MKNNCIQESCTSKICCDTSKLNRKHYMNFDDIVNQAIFNDGKKYKHQYRIPTKILKEYETNILRLKDTIVRCQDFDNILKSVSSVAIKGIGDLTKYDVAFRMGCAFGIFPDKVYLHAGTKVGAIKLGLVKKYSRKQYLTLDDMPDWLKNVEPYQIEDFLCIYKKEPTQSNLNEYLLKACGQRT